jgi:hypothetical protein
MMLEDDNNNWLKEAILQTIAIFLFGIIMLIIAYKIYMYVG